MNSTLDFSNAVLQDVYAFFEFHNCTLASEYAALSWRIADEPLFYMMDVIRDGLSGYFSRQNRSLPTNSELIQWFGEDLKSDYSKILSLVDNYVENSCIDDLCPRLGWRGDTDLAGIGMLINYFLMAIISTAYWSLLPRWETLQQSMVRYIPSRLLMAVKYSIRVVLDTSIVFTLAMLVAATYTYGKVLASRENYMTEYSSLVASYLAFWSVFPVLLLQASAFDKIRRTNTRTIVYCLMAIVGFTNFVLWSSKNAMNRTRLPYEWDEVMRYDPDFQSWFDFWCLPSSTMDQFTKIIYYLAVTGFVLMVYTMMMTWPESAPKTASKLTNYSPALMNILRYVRIPAFLKRRYDLIYAPIICITMWIFLGVFVHNHTRVIKLSGPSNKERELSFGQVLSLTTWLPPLIEFGHIYFKGPREALTGQLVKPYHAEARGEEKDGEIRSEQGNEQRVASYMEITEENLQLRELLIGDSGNLQQDNNLTKVMTV